VILTKAAILRSRPLAARFARAHTNSTMRGHLPVLTSMLLLPLGAILLAPQITRADDIKLKDGSKISGTIVGFEENSFKIKTSYGFAIVQKDQVVSISMSDAPKAADKSAEPATEKSAPAEKTAVTATPKSESLKPIAPPLPAMSGSEPEPTAKAAPSSPAPTPTPASVKAAAKSPAAPAPAPVAKATPVSASKSGAAVPSVAASAPSTNAVPPKSPEPEPIREAVKGNVYTNETYRFHMYKPPDWDVIATAPAVLPGAITAMGTGDDTTYFLIGQEPAGKSLATDMDTTEKRLRDVMVNFRALDQKQITVSGATATAHRFRGSVDQHDWSGVVVLVARGQKLFTIFGMTRADNDLVQIQENVIARAISSLQFTD
jgi:hypothetical protein